MNVPSVKGNIVNLSAAEINIFCFHMVFSEEVSFGIFCKPAVFLTKKFVPNVLLEGFLVLEAHQELHGP